MNTQQLMEGYKNYLRHTKKRSENTIRGYVSDLKHFLSVTKNIENITRVEILDYVQELNKTLSAKTVHRRVASIQSLFDYMVNYGIAKEDVSQNIPLPSVKQKIRKCPTQDEIERIIANESLEQARIAIQLGAYVGLRVSEVCNLKVEDIDFNKSVAILRDTKTAESQEVMIDDVTLENIKHYVTKNRITNGNLLRTKHGKVWSERNLHKYLQGKFDFSFHGFRHACATRLANEADIHVAKFQLRHKALSTTLAYVHKMPETQLSALNNLRKTQ